MNKKKTFAGLVSCVLLFAVFVVADFSLKTQSGNLVLDPASGKVHVNGSVGIGTSNPSADLEISSSNNSKTKQLRLSQNGNLGIELITSGGGFTNWRIGAQNLVSDAFEITPSTTAGGTSFTTPAVIVSSSGNVGVGTTSPGALLEVAGGVRGGNFVDRDNTAYNVDPNYLSHIANLRIGATSNAENTLSVSGDADVTGKLGVGTTSPKAKLEVSSVIKSTPTDSPGTCNSDMRGGMYYDASLNEPCFCDGSNWKQFDGGGNC